MSRIYIASSWRNGFQQQLVQELRKRGHKVYDFRHPNGRNDAPVWESVSITQNLRSAYKEKCLNGKDFKRMLLDRLSVERFNEHFSAMQDADTCILLLPAGRSSHIEAGHMNGMGKRVFVMDTSKEVTPELMYLALDDYFSDFEELYKAVDKPTAPPPTGDAERNSLGLAMIIVGLCGVSYISYKYRKMTKGKDTPDNDYSEFCPDFVEGSDNE